ncbi:MAG: hypothetical protein UHO61_09255 [Acutalibacteraceae bacterium]|nr:hypothetical protein [Acutalibacteraceae bacterium]
MYYCLNCGFEFENAEIFTETHGLTFPPFEERLCCPFCASGNIKTKDISYCRCCGARLGHSEKEYCSPSCRKRGEEMRRREIKKKKLIFSSSLFKTVREVDEYNKNNHTDYSYGQYVTLVKPYLKRGRKK